MCSVSDMDRDYDTVNHLWNKHEHCFQRKIEAV